MNKVTSSGLAVRYSVQPGEAGFEVTRYATKSYAFVGMDRATARSCASAKRSQYTREYARVKTVSGSSGSSATVEVAVVECPCDIAETPQGGGMWQVQVSVNETDTKPSAEIPSDPASLFTAANGRNYDAGEGDGGGKPLLVLNSVSRGEQGASVSYSANIEGFVAAALVLQFKTSESGSWNGASRTSSGLYAGVPASGDCWCRLMYGSVESNTVEA